MGLLEVVVWSFSMSSTIVPWKGLWYSSTSGLYSCGLWLWVNLCGTSLGTGVITSFICCGRALITVIPWYMAVVVAIY